MLIDGDMLKACEWYTEASAIRVLLHIALACHPTEWRHCGMACPAFSLLSSSRAIADALKTEQHTVLAALKRLESSGYVAAEPRPPKHTLYRLLANGIKLISIAVPNTAIPTAIPVLPPTPPTKVDDITDTSNKMLGACDSLNAQQPRSHARDESLPRPPSSPEEVLAAARLAGDARATIEDARAFCDYYESQGWRKANGLAVVSWRGAFSEWMRRKNEQKKEMKNDADYANIRGGHYVSTDFSDYDTTL